MISTIFNVGVRNRIADKVGDHPCFALIVKPQIKAFSAVFKHKLTITNFISLLINAIDLM